MTKRAACLAVPYFHTIAGTVAVFLLWLLGTILPCQAAVEFLGAVQNTTVAADRVDLLFEQGAVARITMLHTDVVHIRINPAGTLSTWAHPAIDPRGLTPPGAQIFNTTEAVYLISPDMQVVVLKAPFRIVILRPDNSVLLADAPLAVGIDTTTGAIFNQKLAPTAEHYFGFGMRGGPISRRGRTFLMFNTDSFGYGELDDPLYISIPFYYGMHQGRAYGVLVDSPAAPFFNVDAAATGLLIFGASAGELSYYVLAGPEPARVAHAYAKLTGFTPLPPKWALGYQQSRYGYKSQTEMLTLATTFRARRIPCDALYFDLDYTDNLRLFSWHPTNFPDPVRMNAQLEAAGFKRVNIIDPMVLGNDPLWSGLAEAGYFLLNRAGEPVINTIFTGDVSWIDFTKSALRSWYKEVLKVFLSTGVSAIWNDLNEPAQNVMPEAIYDFDGEQRTDLQARNLYALKEVSLSAETLKELRPNERPWILSRSGYPGIQRYAANWSGDTLSSFESLRVSVQISVSMGLSGQNFFGHDIGGFYGSPSAELFLRWLQFASYTPLFRNHAVHVAAPREPWQFGAPYTEMIKQIIEQRYRLLPYTYSLFERAARDASPVLAPTVYYFPADARTYRQDTEFMWGPYLLVAPVVTEGATRRSLYLPSGSNWRDYYTDQLYAGGQEVSVSAPLQSIPVFVRAGAIIPSGPVMQYVTEPVAPQRTVDLYPGPAGSFTLYEDDGESLAYTTGDHLYTRLSQIQRLGVRRFSIQRVAGQWQPPAQPWWLRFHAVSTMPMTVTLNGEALARTPTQTRLQSVSRGWFYNAAKATVVVKFPDASTPRNIVVYN